MRKGEALAHFETNDVKSIVVSTGEHEYDLNIETVLSAEEDPDKGDCYVWGGYWKKLRSSLRPAYQHKWFWLGNVTFVRTGFLDK